MDLNHMLLRRLLILLAVGRAGFDILENSLLLFLIEIFPKEQLQLVELFSW